MTEDQSTSFDVIEQLQSEDSLTVLPCATLHSTPSGASVSRSSTNASSVYSVMSNISSGTESQVHAGLSSCSSHASDTNSRQPLLTSKFSIDLSTINASTSQSSSNHSTPVANGLNATGHTSTTRSSGSITEPISVSRQTSIDLNLKKALNSLQLSDSGLSADEGVANVPSTQSTEVSLDPESIMNISFGGIHSKKSGSRLRLDSESSDEEEAGDKKMVKRADSTEYGTESVEPLKPTVDIATKTSPQLGEPTTAHNLRSPVDPVDPDSELNQPTMWLGTEDGW